MLWFKNFHMTKGIIRSLGAFSWMWVPNRDCAIGTPSVDDEDCMMKVIRAEAVQMSPVLHSRPELVSLQVDRTPSAHVHDRFEHTNPVDVKEASHVAA
jgi:hypothetical protein